MEAEAPQGSDILWKIKNTPDANPLYKKAALILDSVDESIDANPQLAALRHQNYPAILLSSLLSSLQTYLERNSLDNIPAVLLLMNYAVYRVKPGLLLNIENPLLACFEKIIASSGKVPHVGKFITSIFELYLVLKPANDWDGANAQVMFDYILENLTDEKPKVRKQANKSISALIDAGVLTKVKGTAKRIEKFVLENVKDGITNSRQCVLLMYFLSSSLKKFPLDMTCNILHQLMVLLKNENCSTELATHVYTTIEALLAARTLDPDLVESYLKDFLNNPPIIDTNSHINIAYAQCLVQTLLHLHTLDSGVTKNYISACISLCGELLLAESQKIISHAAKSIELIISYTVEPMLWVDTSSFSGGLFAQVNIDALDLSDSKGPTGFQKVVAVIRHFLSSRYATAHTYVCGIIGTFFEHLEVSCQEYTKDLVCEFVEKRSVIAHDLWQATLGKFIQKLGPELLLQYFPLALLETDLNDEEYEHKSNSWLLPLLNRFTKVTSVKLFFDHLLPVAQKIRHVLDTQILRPGSEAARLFEILYTQIWELFPKFCKFTKEDIGITGDLFTICLEMAKELNSLALRHVFKGLENVIGYILKLPRLNNPELVRWHLSIQEQSDKLSPLLCKTYIMEPAAPKNILNLIRAIAFLCSQQYLERIYLKNIQKIIDDKEAGKLQSNMLIRIKETNLLLNIVEAMELKDVKYDITIKFLKTFLSDNSIMQKKSYKILSVLMDKVHPTFLMNLFSLMKEHKTPGQHAKHARLGCIQKIFDKMMATEQAIEDTLVMIQEFLPEILLAMKETNHKTRNGAADLIDSLVQKFSEKGMVEDFISLIIGAYGAKTSLMKSAAIKSAGRALFAAKLQVSETFKTELMSLTMLLLREKNREIYKSVLAFLKMYIKVITKDQLREQLPGIFTALFTWDEDGLDSNLALVKFFIEKMLRKLDQETVENAVPQDHRKLVKHVSKMERQEKKKKLDKKNERTSKSQFEDAFNRVLNKISKKSKRNAKFSGKTGDDDDDDEGATVIHHRQRQDGMQIEPSMNNENNLLLRFDAEKERFHFEEHPVVKIRAQRAKQQELAKEDVFFDDKTGKLIVQGNNTISGFKRRREDRYLDEELDNYFGQTAEGKLDEDAKQEATKNKMQKKVKVGKDLAVTSTANKEETRTGPRVNSKVISDFKVMRSGQESTALIQLTPKVLNKRNKVHASKAFEFLVSKKKSGAFKGMTMKSQAQST